MLISNPDSKFDYVYSIKIYFEYILKGYFFTIQVKILNLNEMTFWL